MPLQIGPFTIGPPDNGGQASQGYDPSQSLAGGAGGGAPAAAPAPSAGPYQPTAAQLAVLQQLVGGNGGGLLGQPTPVMLKDPYTGTATSPDPSGAYTFTFANGATVDIDPNGGVSNFKAKTPAASATSVSANTTDPFIVARDASGALVKQDNPNYQQPAPTAITTNTTDPKIVMRDPKDPTNLVTVDNPNYKAPAPTSVSTNTTDPFIVTRDASGNLTQQTNPNYTAPAPTAVSTNTTDQFIVMRDPKSGQTQTVPNPNYQKPAPAAVSTNTTDPYIVMRDPTTGATSTQPNPNYQKPAATVAGGGATTDQFILTRDPTTGALSQQPNPNYRQPAPTVMQTGTGPTTTYWDPTTQSMQSMPNPDYQPTDPGRMTQQLQQQIQQQQQSLQQKIQDRTMTADQASAQFNKWWGTNVEPMKSTIATAQATQQLALQKQQQDIATSQAQAQNYANSAAYNVANLGETASENAQRNALSLLPYMGGAGFGQAQQQVAGGGRLTPQQIVQATTFSLPNLQEIGRQGAAAALANYSPTAQAHLQTMGPPPTPAVGGMPDLSGLLNMNNYGFSAPAASAGAPGGPPPGGPPPGAAPIDWNALLQRQQQSSLEQAAQAQIPWGTYTPAQ
jgi:hypothetical protein